MTQTHLLNKPIGPYGFGLMGLTWRASPPPREQSFATMRASLDAGANFWNGGEFYGPPTNNSLILLREYFTQYPDDAAKVVLSIKGGAAPNSLSPDGSPANIRRCVDESLAQLAGTKSIDIYECARIDPDTPLETTLTTLKELIAEGKISAIGLSEVSAATIRKAAALAPIAAVEVELSLWSTDILTNGVAAACAEHSIPIVAYSPLGRGALTGTPIRRNADLPEGDMRRYMPKFQDDVLEVNNRIVDEVQKLAKAKGVTAAQIALAWVRSFSGREIEDPTQGGKKVRLGEVIPIPGATTVDRVRENMVEVTLTEGEVEVFDELIRKFPTEGGRYPEAHAKWLEG